MNSVGRLDKVNNQAEIALQVASGNAAAWSRRGFSCHIGNGLLIVEQKGYEGLFPTGYLLAGKKSKKLLPFYKTIAVQI